MTERRRSPRIEVQTGETVRLELRHRIQLMDISQTGALIGCDAGLPVGTRGYLRAGLAAQPFSAEVAIKRHHVRSGPRGQVALGSMFGSMDDRSREHLDKFLQRARD